ncbi:Oidioi.mRNA.OKI2018_I69.chr2.g4833.t3.cds [Oikopleura dioica]|uniref:Oidioi.mRNA.OKI2018_I69.chr2.g4833.t3.cds n=1 Tax=Oikopleura dioica TaxID=34765 RepID=A0ABN7T520_OIKDI|nr:Oidioi.mRNA.OKI2018_I69.chr2.g4833.t3.cds [Oikopleura dioica]
MNNWNQKMDCEIEQESYDLSCGQKFALWICCRKREEDIFDQAHPYDRDNGTAATPSQSFLTARRRRFLASGILRDFSQQVVNCSVTLDPGLTPR